MRALGTCLGLLCWASTSLARPSSAVIPVDSTRINHVAHYCKSILNSLKRRSQPATPLLKRLLDDLMEVENENFVVTSRYRQVMGDLAETRQWIRRMLTDPNLDAQYRAYLEERSSQLHEDMSHETLEQLERTKEFERRKERINLAIAGLTGEVKAHDEAVQNRDYIDSSTR